MEENMSNLTSASGDQTSLSSGGNIRPESNNGGIDPHQYFAPSNQTQLPPKKKRNLPGNPDPDAEVIALSPKTLMATNRFVCEICNKGFQRDQNLQLHRRGHNLPWKLKQRSSKEIIRKKVYVCPEASCVHHEASRALGDLTGIKKHFCRKHGEKKWKCDKCTKRYAVQSDWKAHSKTCGTRESRCDCGTLFSRRDSFITHRAFCDALAEESARSINTGNENPLPLTLTSSSSQAAAAGNSTSVLAPPRMINNVQAQPQLFNNNMTPHDLHAFSMKKAQQHFTTTSQIPQWLASPPPPPGCQGPQQHIPMDQHYHQEFKQSQDNPNPNPVITSNSPHMSATALLQKAAQMGATTSSKNSTCSSSLPAMNMNMNMIRPHQAHVSSASANYSTTGFGLNSLSSREQLEMQASAFLASSGNKAVFPAASAGLTREHESPAATACGGAGARSPPLPNSSFLQDMMLRSSQSHGSTTFEDYGFSTAGFLDSKKLGVVDFYETKAHHHHHHHHEAAAAGGGGNGNGKGNDGMTRDFLGLRPLSNTDILNIAGMQRNCININTSSSSDDDQNYI